MPRPFLLGFLVLLIVGSARAEVVPELYHGEAIITGQDNLDERARGVREALTQVLVKVSGDDRIAEHPTLPSILAGADAYVLRYEYADRKKGVQISDEQGTRDRSFHFMVEFDPAGVHGILSRLGLDPWHEDRPRLLVILAVTDHAGAFIVGTEESRGIGHRETLEIDAKRRGLPLVLPKMDTVEALAVSHQEVASTSGAAVGALAASYRAGAVLAGAMTISSQGYWTTDWTLLADDVPDRWRVPESTFDRAISQALGHSARVLAGVK